MMTLRDDELELDSVFLANCTYSILVGKRKHVRYLSGLMLLLFTSCNPAIERCVKRMVGTSLRRYAQLATFTSY